MHILLMILSVVGVLGFWWYRMQAAGRAAGEIVDYAQRARGAVKRRNFRNKAGQSPFTAIDDPVIGAATIIWAIADDCGAVGPELATEVETALTEVATQEAAQEAVIYGQWAVGQVTEPSTAIKRIAPLLIENLTDGEREQFVTMTTNLLTNRAESRSVLRTSLQTLRKHLKLTADVQ